MTAVLVAMAGTLAFTAYVALVIIPHARFCITQDHGECWREPKQLTFARGWLRIVRWLAGLFWLAIFGLFLLDLGSWSAEHILMGVFLAAQGYLWTRLVFPPELAGRLAELERADAAPWEALP